MFQFPAFAPRTMAGYQVFNLVGCPIRISPDQWLFAPPRSFSQLITSFFASESQGIHPAPLITFLFSFVCTRFVLFYLEELLRKSCTASLFPHLRYLLFFQHVKELN